MKMTVWVETNLVGSLVEREVEVDDEDLEGLEGDERQAFLHDYAMDEIWDLFEWGWKEK